LLRMTQKNERSNKMGVILSDQRESKNP
jgi:hypothetical protein